MTNTYHTRPVNIKSKEIECNQRQKWNLLSFNTGKAKNIFAQLSYFVYTNSNKVFIFLVEEKE